MLPVGAAVARRREGAASGGSLLALWSVAEAKTVVGGGLEAPFGDGLAKAHQWAGLPAPAQRERERDARGGAVVLGVDDIDAAIASTHIRLHARALCGPGKVARVAAIVLRASLALRGRRGSEGSSCLGARHSHRNAEDTAIEMYLAPHPPCIRTGFSQNQLCRNPIALEFIGIFALLGAPRCG